MSAQSINAITENYFKSTQDFVHWAKITDSTNAWAKLEFPSTSSFAVFLADQQTAGRGRGSNTWSQAQAGSTLLSTWCLRLTAAPHPLCSLRIGLALFESLVATWPACDWSLKAPNDIYLSSGKFAGILSEVSGDSKNHCLFIGIGANVFAKPLLAEQDTSALSEFVNFSEKDWWEFCYRLKNAFLQIQVDVQRSLLLADETQRILRGLELFPGNQVVRISAQGDLVLKNGQTIAWNDL